MAGSHDSINPAEDPISVPSPRSSCICQSLGSDSSLSAVCIPWRQYCPCPLRTLLHAANLLLPMLNLLLDITSQKLILSEPLAHYFRYKPDCKAKAVIAKHLAYAGSGVDVMLLMFLRSSSSKEQH